MVDPVYCCPDRFDDLDVMSWTESAFLIWGIRNPRGVLDIAREL